MSSSEEIRVEYQPLADIARAPRNPKLHDHDALGASIGRFGFVQPMTVDERTGQLVAGHGRLEALQKRQAAGEPPPLRVKLGPAGEWLVPVLRGVRFETEAEAQAYLIADNRLVEVGGWDDRALTDLMRDMRSAAGSDALAGTGFDDQMLAALVYATRPATEIAGLDEAGEWVGMPEYDEGENPHKLIVSFRSPEDRQRFLDEKGIRVDKMATKGKTWSTRWPWTDREDKGSLRVTTGPEIEAA